MGSQNGWAVNTGQIGRDRLAEPIELTGSTGGGQADAGGIDEDVKPVVALGEAVDRAAQRCVVGEVAGDRLDMIRRGPGAAETEDLSAGIRQTCRDRRPNAAGRAGHDSAAPLQRKPVETMHSRNYA